MFGRDTGLQPAKHFERREGATVRRHLLLAPSPERAGDRRHVDVAFLRVQRHRRQDADDGMRAVVHLKHLPDDRRIAAETRLPVPVTEQQHGLGAMMFVGRHEIAAGQRLYTKDVEKIRRDDAGGDAIGFAAPNQIERHLMELDEAQKSDVWSR